MGSKTIAQGDAPLDIYKNFRRNLKLLRTECELMPEDLGLKLGITSKRVLDLEYGKHGRGIPKVDEVIKIAKIFNVSTEDIIHKKAKVFFPS